MQKFLFVLFSIVLLFSCSVQRDTSESSELKDRKFYKVYSKKLGIELQGTERRRFVKALAEWIGSPYKFGGCEKTGTDCSCLIKAIYHDAFFMDIPRNSVEMFDTSTKITKQELQEGDLVFFAIGSEKPSHVGVYIGNQKFIHASTSKGVIISDLTESYYVKYYHGAGRFLKHG